MKHPLLSKAQAVVEGMAPSKNAVQAPIYTLSLDQLKELEEGEVTWVYKLVFDRVIQHDIRVIAKYYTQFHLKQLAQMLSLNETRVEEYISGLVSIGSDEMTTESKAPGQIKDEGNRELQEYKLKAKIDRSGGVVLFDLEETPDATLMEYTGKISELLGLVENTCHLIHKENMIFEAKQKQIAPTN